MVNYLTVPFQGVVLAGNEKQQQLVQRLQVHEQHQHGNNGGIAQASPVLVSDEQRAVTSAPPAMGGPWALCRDQQGRMFWLNNNTGKWTYAVGATATQIMQPPPPPQYVHISQVAQPQANTAWVVSPPTSPPQQQMMWVPVGVSPTRSDVQDGSGDKKKEVKRPSKSKSKVVYLDLPTWKECWNAEGKIVWIHRETGKLVHTDPYE
ncbi:unnamed protein product [Sphacelaria rigidula]